MKEKLLQQDAQRDVRICGVSLVDESATRFAQQGAHDPTATYYFVLEKLFPLLELDESSHLLDVGCGAGRALAYYADAGLPGRATGIELDPALAKKCSSWSQRFPSVSVLQGSVLDTSLAPYTHFYLYNPFDSHVLAEFIQKVETEAKGPVTVLHASDNGEKYNYLVRAGWSLQAQGEIYEYQGVPVYGCPQHYSLWHFDPRAL